jgi:hypothetical protein
MIDDGLEEGLPDENELVGTAQIAAMWRLNREYVTNHVTKTHDFPAPALNLSRKTRRWLRVDVEAWRRKHSGR